MENTEEFLKKDSLIKKYSEKPLPKFLKFIGNIKELNEYEDWIKDQKVTILKWIGTYLVILPFFISFCLFVILPFINFCLSALNLKTNPNVLEIILLAEGISVLWYLRISYLQDKRGAING